MAWHPTASLEATQLASGGRLSHHPISNLRNMDFSVTLSGVPGGTEASNDNPAPTQHAEDNTLIVPVDTAMERIEDGGTAGTDLDESSKNGIDRMAFVE